LGEGGWAAITKDATISPKVMAMNEGCTVGRGGVRRQFIFMIKIE